MRILGIIAEYDPFHAGHLFHLSESKARVRPDLTYIALSPCLKQRGELSLLSPFDRARCALSASADAVFCLPAAWTVRDAEHYALGAVSLLNSLGVTHLAFGAETADGELLRSAAELLESPSDVLTSSLRKKLSDGMGYPAAVSASLGEALPAAAGLLDRPNNVLAVCYFRAILRLHSAMVPVVIPRAGNYHAAEIDALAPSASALRDSLRRGHYAALRPALPPETFRLIRQRCLENRIPDENILDALLTFRLREMDEADYRRLPDVSEGIENALRAAAARVGTRGELLGLLSGKRYPASRVSRLCACALLGLSRDSLESLPLPENALLLGLRRHPEMTAQWRKLSVPVISSPAAWKTAASPADLAAWRLWAQCCRLPDTLPFTEQIVCL
jgi:Predicted nucleotidyltransferase